MTRQEKLDALANLATELYARGMNDDIEIDPLTDKDISEGDNGTWVRAWVFISASELRKNGIPSPYI